MEHAKLRKWDNSMMEALAPHIKLLFSEYDQQWDLTKPEYRKRDDKAYAEIKRIIIDWFNKNNIEPPNNGSRADGISKIIDRLRNGALPGIPLLHVCGSRRACEEPQNTNDADTDSKEIVRILEETKTIMRRLEDGIQSLWEEVYCLSNVPCMLNYIYKSLGGVGRLDTWEGIPPIEGSNQPSTQPQPKENP